MKIPFRLKAVQKESKWTQYNIVNEHGQNIFVGYSNKKWGKDMLRLLKDVYKMGYRAGRASRRKK